MLIKFNENNLALAAAIGAALLEYGKGEHAGGVPDDTTPGEAEAIEVMREAASEYLANGTVAVKSGDAPFAAETPTTTTQGTSADAAGAYDPEPLDEKLVQFNGQFCGKAEKPFYASGKRKGQWKKRQGVDEAEYDGWYASALANVTPAVEEHQGVDTSAEFGGGQQQQKSEPKTFANAGEFMAWVSENQAAKTLTQADVDSAYKIANVAIPDLFNEATAGDAIAAVYTVLANIAAGQS